MLDPVIHAALVTLAVLFVKWLFALVGINLGDEIAGQLAEFVVAYILSLFGYGLYIRAVFSHKNALLGSSGYKPPFTS